MSKCRKCREPIPDGSRFCLHCGAKQELTHAPKARSNGQGTAYQLPNKTWIARKVVGYEVGENGKVRKQTRSKSGFKTKKEALEYLPQLGKTPREKNITMKQLYDTWLPTHRASRSTMNCYKAAWKYFKDIEEMKVQDITIDDLQECMDECPKGRRTRENMKAMCGLLYKYGIPRRITDMNMGEYLIVSGETGSKDGLPLEYVDTIRENVDKVPGADYVLCQCYLGFRPSELLALDAIHYDRKEKAFIGGAKTDAGKDRIVTVSPKIQSIVERLTRDKLSGAVFCASNGSRMGIKEYRALFYSVLENCGLENPAETKEGVTKHKYTPHSCRHTFATMMKRVNASDKDKMALIGHASEAMLRHYQDVNYEDLRRITDVI